MSNEMSPEYTNKMIAAFVDKPEKTFWYQNAFSKFNVNGMDVMKWQWSWWAFGGGFLFLLYRKQYLASLILFIASVTIGMFPLMGLIIAILAGGYSPYFIYKGYKSKLGEIERQISDEDKRVETMAQIGGYHQWVIWVYVLFVLFIGISVISYITALASLAN
jgi:hypothetical protein